MCEILIFKPRNKIADLDGCFGNLVIFGNDETIKNKTNNYNLKLILQAAKTKQSGFLLALYKPRKTPNY